MKNITFAIIALLISAQASALITVIDATLYNGTTRTIGNNENLEDDLTYIREAQLRGSLTFRGLAHEAGPTFESYVSDELWHPDSSVSWSVLSAAHPEDTLIVEIYHMGFFPERETFVIRKTSN